MKTNKFILSEVYEKALRELERSEITIGEFEKRVEIEVIPVEWLKKYIYERAEEGRENDRFVFLAWNMLADFEASEEK